MKIQHPVIRLTSDDGSFFVEETVSRNSDLEKVIGRLKKRLAFVVANAPDMTYTRHRVGVQLDNLIHNIRTADDLDAMCWRVLGKQEMARCGSRWRKRAHDEPDKLKRVLSDMSLLQREGRCVKNPGSYAEYLWKQFV